MIFKSKETKIDKKQVYQWGIGAGVIQFSYILLVSLVIYFTDQFIPKGDFNILGFISLLILFVISAAVSGLIVFGYPVYLALHKSYYQAVATVLVTILTLFFEFLVLILLILIFFN